jgi:hypothetical protein
MMWHHPLMFTEHKINDWYLPLMFTVHNINDVASSTDVHLTQSYCHDTLMFTECKIIDRHHPLIFTECEIIEWNHPLMCTEHNGV